MMYYSASMNTLDESLMNAVKEGKLLESSRTNIRLLLDGTKSPIAREAVEELAAAGEWQELNDRFYKTLAFGTGGLRGRTIGSIVTRAEQGNGAGAGAVVTGRCAAVAADDRDCFCVADHRHELFHGLLLRNNHANVSLRMKCGRGF